MYKHKKTYSTTGRGFIDYALFILVLSLSVSSYLSIYQSLYFTVYRYICMYVCACLHLLICWQEICFKFREPAKNSWQYVFAFQDIWYILVKFELWMVDLLWYHSPTKWMLSLQWDYWFEFHDYFIAWDTTESQHPVLRLLWIQHEMQQNPVKYRDHFVYGPANERWHYNVTLSLIGWAHSQNEPWHE